MKKEREIKFRTWDKKKKEMGYNPVYTGTATRAIGINQLQNMIESKGMTLMQYTGLKDKNEKEIWEGDVIREKDEYGADDVYEVAFECGGFWLKDRDNEIGWPDVKNIKTIGNIYENPDLLT